MPPKKKLTEDEFWDHPDHNDEPWKEPRCDTCGSPHHVWCDIDEGAIDDES